jgi:hypothetical protein
MNRWNIPDWLEKAVTDRDRCCIYCGVDFDVPSSLRGMRPSWEHIVNDAKIVTGSRVLADWLQSNYCKRKSITELGIAQIARAALVDYRNKTGK